jgi:hypothetical protein
MASNDRYMLWYKAEIGAVSPLSLDEEHTCIGHIRASDELAISAWSFRSLSNRLKNHLTEDHQH